MSDPFIDAREIVTRERLLKAVRASRGDLSTPMDRDTSRREAERPDLSLSACERFSIALAFSDSTRFLAGFADRTLRRYDDLYAGERLEALDLFADIVHHPLFYERGVILRPPEPGIER